MLLNCGVGEDLRVPWTARRFNQSILKEISLECSSEKWCWSWNSNTLATWCKELTHLKRPWCWESLRAGGEGDDRGWYGWMTSLTQWTWVWVNSGSWWWTGRPGVLWSMELQRVRQDWATELNWTRFVIAFLPRSKDLLISWLLLPSVVIFEPKKRKSVTASTFSPTICHEVMGLDTTISVFLNVEF